MFKLFRVHSQRGTKRWALLIRNWGWLHFGVERFAPRIMK